MVIENGDLIFMGYIGGDDSVISAYPKGRWSYASKVKEKVEKEDKPKGLYIDKGCFFCGNAKEVSGDRGFCYGMPGPWHHICECRIYGNLDHFRFECNGYIPKNVYEEYKKKERELDEKIKRFNEDRKKNNE